MLVGVDEFSFELALFTSLQCQRGELGQGSANIWASGDQQHCGSVFSARNTPISLLSMTIARSFYLKSEVASQGDIDDQSAADINLRDDALTHTETD